MNNSYLKIADHYFNCFKKHGNTPKGLDWDNQDNMNKRYEIMRGFLKSYDVERFPPFDFKQPTVLDFGCGIGGFWNHLSKRGLDPIKYTGIDINPESIKYCKNKYPEIKKFYCLDILSENSCVEQVIPNFDYIILNGVFTVKDKLTQNEMIDFMCSTLEKLWTKTNKGIAFNCMSKVLDFERDDLFHVSFDQLSQWIYDNLSNKFTIRQDYGLREFTVYVYK